MSTQVVAPPAAAAARPLADEFAFRSGMRALTGAVCVIATGTPGQRGGLTATAVCSITASPPRLLACVNKSTATHALVVRNGRLSINVLAADQLDVARRFAGLEPGVAGDARFRDHPWTEVDGVPVLAGASVSFVCRLAECIGQSTHTMFLCDVVEVRLPGDEPRPAAPLLYVEGHFRHLSAIRGAEQPLIEWLW